MSNDAPVKDERGSAIAMALILAGFVFTLGAVVAGLVYLGLMSRAQQVANEAALTAVDVAIGRAPGNPCEEARNLVVHAGFQVPKCSVESYESRVELHLYIGTIRLVVRAHAGLEPSLP